MNENGNLLSPLEQDLAKILTKHGVDTRLDIQSNKLAKYTVAVFRSLHNLNHEEDKV